MIRDLLARTVSASIIGVDVIVSLPGGDVLTRGTWTTLDEERDIIAGEGKIGATVLRTPIASLPSEPEKNTRITVDGDVYKVDNIYRRGANFLIDLKKVAVR
ncbi:hypothetical protein H9Q09_11930 [Aurantimonas sp. DM33-3]|uniref:hypothetical protein n=1 Tax=Aurantimonas sp. DM33-3 TaxID=2766955 RepID=UPI0016522C3B|nr:hypothetical protein [Aurantimonas sp. DM33-3]MBC6716917.1 hypothetical protein [Aurantimonas sp. DM33-3]